MQLMMNDNIKMGLYDLRQKSEDEVRKRQNWCFFEGLLFMIAGFMQIALPEFTGFPPMLIVGVALFMAGMSRLANAFHFKAVRLWRIMSGIALLTAGSSILWWPVAGKDHLIFLIGGLLLVEGIFQLSLSLACRPMRHWIILLASGTASFGLGVIIFSRFPGIGLTLLSATVGLSLLYYGTALLAFSWNARSNQGMS